VQTDRGFVLHEATFADADKPAEPVFASTMRIPGGLGADHLQRCAGGDFYRRGSAQGAGLAGLFGAWGEGQLESELGENSWLTVPADSRLIFDTPVAQRYEQALQLLGLQAWMLSPDAGHA
jgi:putative transcriptional regulator